MKAGWRVVPLGEVCSFENGDRGTNYPGRKAFVSSGVPFVNAGHLVAGRVDLSEMNFIPIAHFNRLGSGKIRKGDLLFCLRGSLGKFALVDNLDGGAIASSLVIVRPANSLLAEFLARFFESDLCSEQIHAFANGAAQPNLSGKSLAAFQIPLPPLDEQKRIVAVLDEAFEGLSRARANAEANLADARELFETGVGSAFNAANVVNAGGSLSRLGDLAELTYGYTTKAHSVPTGPKFLRITDIQDGSVDWSRVPFCTEPPEDKERYRLIPGDIVFARTGATTGKSYLIWEEEDVVAASYLIRLRLKSPRVLPDFLAFFFQSDAYWTEIRAGISGSTQGGFNASKLGELLIPVPSIDAQTAIVERLKELKGSIFALDCCETEKLLLVETLRQSLLQKAFSGELTR